MFGNLLKNEKKKKILHDFAHCAIGCYLCVETLNFLFESVGRTLLVMLLLLLVRKCITSNHLS